MNSVNHELILSQSNCVCIVLCKLVFYCKLDDNIGSQYALSLAIPVTVLTLPPVYLIFMETGRFCRKVTQFTGRSLENIEDRIKS